MGAGGRDMRVTRTLKDNNVAFVAVERGLLSADTGRDPATVDILVRALLRSRHRVLCARQVRRSQSYLRLSTETAPARGDHLCRAVRLLAWSSQGGRRLRTGHCSDGPC